MTRYALFWEYFQHYHSARSLALIRSAESVGIQIVPISLFKDSRDEHESDVSTALEPVLRRLCDCSAPAKAVTRAMLLCLDEIQPSAVGIIGYTNPTSRAVLGWCRRHRAGAVLMLESKASDFLRHRFKEAIKRVILRLFDSVFAGGQPQASYAEALGMPNERIFSGYDCVDNTFWSQAAARVRADRRGWRERLSLPARYFLAIGRFVPKKNFDGLLREYAVYVQHHAQRDSTWSLVLVGDGEMAETLKALARRLGIGDRVIFPGYKLPQDSAPYFALADAFVIPSAHSEQWGLVVNEAMACGLPVFASKVCGCVPDLLIPGRTGFSFDPARPGELAALFRAVGAGTCNLSEMGRAAAAHIRDFSLEHFADQFLRAAACAVTHAARRGRWPWPLAAVWP